MGLVRFNKKARARRANWDLFVQVLRTLDPFQRRKITVLCSLGLTPSLSQESHRGFAVLFTLLCFLKDAHVSHVAGKAFIIPSPYRSGLKRNHLIGSSGVWRLQRLVHHALLCV